MRCVIIYGTAKNAQNSEAISEYLGKTMEVEVYNIRNIKFSDYDYKHENKDDEFIPFMEKLITNYDHFIFITPIYWYSMSAIMKMFLDRISDLLTIEKDLGRQLRGKMMTTVSNSGHDDQQPHFFKPFQLTAEYLGMKYMGDCHVVINDGTVSEEAKNKVDWIVKSYS